MVGLVYRPKPSPRLDPFCYAVRIGKNLSLLALTKIKFSTLLRLDTLDLLLHKYFLHMMI